MKFSLKSLARILAPFKASAASAGPSGRAQQSAVDWQRNVPPDWAVEDVLALRLLLRKGAGEKMLKRGRAWASHLAIEACKDEMHTTHSAGRAAGRSDALDWMESLASEAMEQQLISRAAGVQAANHTADIHQDLDTFADQRKF